MVQSKQSSHSVPVLFIISFFVMFLLELIFYHEDLIIISFRTLFLLFLTILLFVLRKKIPFYKPLIPLLLYGLMILIVELVIGNNGILYALSNIIRLVLVPFLIVHIIYNFVSTETKLKILIQILLIITAINSIFVIGQFLDIPVFWEIRGWISPIDEISIFDSFVRPPGLTLDVMDIAYHLVMFIPLGFFFINKQKKLWPYMAVSLMGLALLLTLRRTAILSVLIVFLIFLLSKHSKLNRVPIIFLTVLFVPIFLLLVTPSSSMLNRILELGDSSALSRPVLFSQGMETIKNSPMGVGIPGYLEKWNTRYLPHNQFLTVGAVYGIPSLILLFSFIYLIGKQLHFQYYHTSGDSQIIIFTVFLSLLAFLIHSLFHNGGFFYGNGEIYIVIGILLAINKIYKTDLKNEE